MTQGYYEPPLPKGMAVAPTEFSETKNVLSQDTVNYSGLLLSALQNVEGLDVEKLHMEVVEEYGEEPVVTLVLRVARKEG